MTAGYAFDKSYQQGVVINSTTGWSHTGIDFGAPIGSSIKAAVGGKLHLSKKSRAMDLIMVGLLSLKLRIRKTGFMVTYKMV
jgi:hypothetical protein